MARILIVEDEIIVATNLEESLAEMGHDVLGCVPSGEQAIELASRQRPELILMDVRLSGTLTGVEAARTIWQTLKIPIVYCTAHPDIEALEAVQTMECYGYVTKPFQSDAVRGTIELALKRREEELLRLRR